MDNLTPTNIEVENLMADLGWLELLDMVKHLENSVNGNPQD